jgi:probable HAF family extracellular repeat protein
MPERLPRVGVVSILSAIGPVNGGGMVALRKLLPLVLILLSCGRGLPSSSVSADGGAQLPSLTALHLDVKGSGRVAIVSNPDVPPCSSSCDASVAVGSTIQVIAVADEDGYFADWGGDCSSFVAKCELLVSGSTLRVTVHFASKTRPRYVAVDIGTLGGHQSEALGIAPNAGFVVGDSQNAVGDGRAFLWDGRAMKDVGASPPSFGAAVNDSGIVVGRQTIPTNGQFEDRAFMFDQRGLHDLGVLGGGRASTAFSVSSRTVIAGVADDGASAQAVVWDSRDPTPVPLAVPNHSYAFGINDSGVIVGSVPLDSLGTAFVYDGNLKTIFGPTVESAALSINNHGQIVGWMMKSEPNGSLLRQGFFLGPDSTVTTVASPVSDTPHASLQSINDLGQAVGYVTMRPFDPADAGILYYGGRVWALTALVEGTPQIVSARGIDNRGQIAATAIIAGVRHAVILRPE